MHAGVYADKHVGYYVTTGLVLTTDCGTINCKLKDDGVSRVDCGMFATYITFVAHPSSSPHKLFSLTRPLVRDAHWSRGLTT